MNSKKICTAGFNYFHVYPNGDIYRCIAYHSNKIKPIGNAKTFTKETFYPLIKTNKICMLGDCMSACDRDWAKKWIFNEDKSIDVIDPGNLEKSFGIQEINNINTDCLHMVWNPTLTCNYLCVYCWAHTSKENIEKFCLSGFPEMSDEEWIVFFEKISRSYKRVIVSLTGGEPFFKIDLIIEIIRRFQNTISFSITTNLSKPILGLTRKIRPENVSFHASLHSTAKMFDYDIFMGRVLLLKKCGFFIVVNFVAYPEQMYLYDKYREEFTKHGVDVELIAWNGWSKDDPEINSESYFEYEKEYVNNMVGVDSKKIEIKKRRETNIENKEYNIQPISLSGTLVGSFYYSWYRKNNWIKKCSRFNRYEVVSEFGDYNSLDENVIKHHIQQAKKAGIDFLISSFNGDDSVEELSFLKDRLDVYDLKFAIQYETVNIFGDPLKSSKNEIDTICKHFDTISKKFMESNSYLRIDGKPVVFIYVSRRIIGDLNEIDIIRDVILKNTGMECIIIGDEIWWPDETWIGSEDRIKKFDYIYSYNMYTPDKTNGNNRYDGDDYLNLIEPVYKSFYEKAKKLNVGLAPNIMPRYNDESVRKREGHYPLPSYGTEFFEKYLEMCKKYFLGENNILLITSFNEWYEDTQIESTGTSWNGNSDEYDKLPNYGNTYLEKVLEFSNEIKGKEMKKRDYINQIAENTIYNLGEKFETIRFFCFDQKYSPTDSGSILYFIDAAKDPVMAFHKEADKLHIIFHNGEEWETIITEEPCNNDFTVEIKGAGLGDIYVNGKKITDIVDAHRISLVYGKVTDYKVHNPKYPDPEPKISKLVKDYKHVFNV